MILQVTIVIKRCNAQLLQLVKSLVLSVCNLLCKRLQVAATRGDEVKPNKKK